MVRNYIVLGYEIYAVVTNYEPGTNEREEFLKDLIEIGKPDFKILYDGPDQIEARTAISRVKGLEQKTESDGTGFDLDRFFNQS
jgi:hypothetical protein